MSRGISNNNPGNIRINKVKYLGEVYPSKDRAFKQFSAPEWGYRAMFVLLHSYRVRYNLTSLRQMIARYAPPVENDTDNYVDCVAKWSGTDADAPLDTMSSTHMCPIVQAMSRMENGAMAIREDVGKGWELFIKHKP